MDYYVLKLVVILVFPLCFYKYGLNVNLVCIYRIYIYMVSIILLLALMLLLVSYIFDQ